MRGNRGQSPKNNSTRIFVIVLVVLIIIAAILFALKIFGNWKSTDTSSVNEVLNETKEEPVVATPKTLSGTSRPIAVMIDNNIDAMPQAGLKEADIVYEMIVEGGETRLMLILQDKDLEKIGPIRSSRHYFLDYALENDAIYVHYGWSPQAQEDISTLGVNNINGIYESSTAFWRVNEKYAPHNVVTSTEDIMNIAERKGYRTTTEQEPVLNYVVSEVNLEDGKTATDIVIPYSDYNSVEYKYDKESKEYVRYSRGEKQVDWTSGDTITTKNIIIEFAENTTIDDGSGKGRQTLDNVKELDGYYITNGKVIPITCTKDSRTSQTVYKDAEGNEIEVNDGKTFIQICPLDSDVTFVEE
jgi:hypothetical protein